MCAHELITLGQNCDFKIQPLTSNENSSSNHSFKTCKVIQIPNNLPDKQISSSSHLQSRIPNLDGNYSDESSDTEQDIKTTPQQCRLSRTNRLYRNQSKEIMTDDKLKHAPSTPKSRNHWLNEKCRSKSTVEGFSLSRTKSKSKKRKRLKLKKVKKKKKSARLSLINSKESSSLLCNKYMLKSEIINNLIDSETTMTEIKDNTNSVVSEGIACITPTNNQSNLNVSSQQSFASANNSLSSSNSVVTVAAGYPSSMAANMVSFAPNTVGTSNVAVRPAGGQLVSVPGMPNQQVILVSGGQAYPAQVTCGSTGQPGNFILTGSPMQMAVMPGGVSAANGGNTTLVQALPTMSNMTYTSQSAGMPVSVAAGSMVQHSGGYITIPQSSIGMNSLYSSGSMVAVSSGGTIATNVITSVPVVAGTSTAPLFQNSMIGDLGPPKLSPEIVTLPPPLVQSKEQKIEPILNKDGNLVWVCNVCNKMLLSENELLNHKKRHKIHEALICPYCNRSYIDKHRYAVHVRIHTGEMPFSCNVCNKKFRDDRKLKLHMARHSSTLSHKCHLCPRSFEGPKALEKHLLAHSSGRHVAPKIITNIDGTVAMGLPVDKNSHPPEPITGPPEQIDPMAARCTIPSPILDNADLDSIVQKLSFDVKSTTDESKDEDSASACSSMISLSMDDVYQYNMPQPAVTDNIR